MRKVESFDALKEERDAELGGAVRALLESPPRGNFPIEIPGFERASVTILPQGDGSIAIEVFAK
ncbi:MAG: hypothetical protein AAB967_02175, partial [Patescibacteria group bacterium]